MPTITCSVTSGKGGSSGVPSTKWVSGRGKGRVSRPGSASAASGRSVLLRKRKLTTSRIARRDDGSRNEPRPRKGAAAARLAGTRGQGRPLPRGDGGAGRALLAGH